MVEYITEIIKTYKMLYLLNPKYKQLRKEELDCRQRGLKNLATLNKIYQNDLFCARIREKQNILNEDKYILAIAYHYNLDTKTSFCYRGFSDNQLKKYYKQFVEEMININSYEMKIKCKK